MSKLFVPVICALVVVGSMAMPNPPGCDPPKKDPSECCDVPMIFEKSEMDNCAAKYGKAATTAAPAAGMPPNEMHHQHPDCMMAECLFNSTKAIVNGNLDLAALKNFVKERLSSAKEWHPIIEKALDECAKDPSHTKMAEVPKGQCNPKYDFIKMCVMVKAFNECPASIYKASPECDEVKKYVAACPIHNG